MADKRLFATGGGPDPGLRPLPSPPQSTAAISSLRAQTTSWRALGANSAETLRAELLSRQTLAHAGAGSPRRAGWQPRAPATPATSGMSQGLGIRIAAPEHHSFCLTNSWMRVQQVWSQMWQPGCPCCRQPACRAQAGRDPPAAPP